MSYSKLSTEEPSLEDKEEEESISDKLKVDLITSIIPKTKLYTFYRSVPFQNSPMTSLYIIERSKYDPIGNAVYRS